MDFQTPQILIFRDGLFSEIDEQTDRSRVQRKEKGFPVNSKERRCCIVYREERQKGKDWRRNCIID